MAPILRGELWWAELDPTRGNGEACTWPVLVLSHDIFNERSRTVITMAVTSREPRTPFPLALELTSAQLPKRLWVKIGQVRTLSVARLHRRIGRVSYEELARVIEGLTDIVGD